MKFKSHASLEDMPLIRKNSGKGSSFPAIDDEPVLQFKTVRKLVRSQVEEIETKRLLRYFHCKEYQELSYR